MIFISYSSKNTEIAEMLRTALIDEGMDVWMARHSIVVGDDFAEAILDAIDACSVFVLLLSRESQESRNVRDELEHAYTADKPILPVHIDNSEINRVYMFRLSSFQFIEVKGRSRDSFDQLIARCKALEGVEKDFARAKKPASTQDHSLLKRVFGIGEAKKKSAKPAKAKPPVAHVSTVQPQQKTVDQTKELDAIAQQIVDLENSYARMSADQLALQTGRFRDRLAKGESLDDLMPEAIATACGANYHASHHKSGIDTVKAAVGLYKGMAVNTFVGDDRSAPIAMAAYVYALEGKGVHVACGSELKALDDQGHMSRMFHLLGISSKVITKNDQSESRREAYRADVTYGNHTAFIFDYLRDNLVTKPNNRVQRGQSIAIVDDVDYTLVDCGRTPCVITAEGSSDGISSCAVCDYFRMYDLLAGISETAAEASEELRGIYRLQLYVVGHDQDPIKCVENEIYLTDEGRWRAIARKARDAGCPVVIEVPRSSYEDAKIQLFKALMYWGIDRDLNPVYIDGKDSVKDEENLFYNWNELTVIVDDVPLYTKKRRNPSRLCVISTVRHNDVRLDHRFENYFVSNTFTGSLDERSGIEFTYMLSLDDPFMQATGDVERVRKIVKAFGMPDDQPIEGNSLTRTLGDVQSRTDNVERLLLKRWIQLESPINWQQLNMFEQRNTIVDSVDVRKSALGMVGRYAESLVDETCPADAPRSSWNLAKLNTELTMLESDVPLPPTRSAQTPEAMLEMVRAWMEDALESKMQSLGLTGSNADEFLGRAMLRCIDVDWLQYRKKAQDMMAAVTWPKLSDDAAWRRTVEQFKEQLGKEYSEFQKNLVKNYLSTIIGVRKSGEKRSSTSSDPYRGVNRNDPCPCGSGKKFKNCHGRPKENA